MFSSSLKMKEFRRVSKRGRGRGGGRGTLMVRQLTPPNLPPPPSPLQIDGLEQGKIELTPDGLW